MPPELEKPTRRETFKRVLFAAQFYPPDPTSTATYLGKIAHAFAAESDVVVLSGTPQSASAQGARTNPFVVELKNIQPGKHAVIWRAVAVVVFTLSMFWSVFRRARKDDLAFCVTNPFTMPYAVVLAAKLRGAATALLIYDLYPEALEAAGFIRSTSVLNRLLRLLNGLMFKALDGIVVVGRDVPPLLLKYPGVSAERIRFIPNWTFLPIAYREPNSSNRFRPRDSAHLVVGLSGNLGFTHDPVTVFEAARILRNESGIHFLLSGWGVGWNQLKDLQAAENLPNVTLLDPVPSEDLTEFLSAADVWIIPYRRNIAGVSIPSRLYNLLAIGRAVIVGAEAHAEAAIELREEKIGWVVPPEDPAGLAAAIRAAAADLTQVAQMGRLAAVAAQKFTEEPALERYCDLIAAIKAAR
jgi:colanic acid biosynthesis glycosyl transferase WcaI